MEATKRKPILRKKPCREKLSDQEETLRAAQKLKDEVVSKLIEELNALEEDPKSGEHLEALLHKRGINMRLVGRLCATVSMSFF